MTLLPKVKLKTMPTFPSNVIGGTGLSASKTNGHVTLDYAWEEFGSISAIPTAPTSHILTWDSATNVYVMVPSALLGGAVAGISDAPSDNVLYGRKNAAWTAAVAEAPNNGTMYARQNLGWVAVTGGGGGIPEAPSDSVLYARRNTAWVAVPPAGIGEAPNDGTVYGRKNLGWIAVTGGGGITEAPDGQLYGRTNPGTGAWLLALPKDSAQALNYLGVTSSGIAADNNYNGLLRLTKLASNTGQYINFVRYLSAVFSIGYLPNSNIFGIGPAPGINADASFNPSFRMINNSAIAMTGQPWVSFEVGAAENGVWFGTGTPNITYHSYSGDAVNSYFTQQMLQFTSVKDSTQFEGALTINVKAQTGYGPVTGNNGKNAIQAVVLGAAGSGQLWVQANNLICQSGWGVGVYHPHAYNTEIDTTNGSGQDSHPLLDTPQVKGIVMGGAPGTHMISDYISIFSSDASSGTYGAHTGIHLSGKRSVGDYTILDRTSSNTAHRIEGNHATGWDSWYGVFSFAQIYCKNFTVAPDGSHSSGPNLVTSHLDDVPVLEKFDKLATVPFEAAFPECMMAMTYQPPAGYGLPTTTEHFISHPILTAMLIKAIRQLRAEITELRGMI